MRADGASARIPCPRWELVGVDGASGSLQMTRSTPAARRPASAKMHQLMHFRGSQERPRTTGGRRVVSFHRTNLRLGASNRALLHRPPRPVLCSSTALRKTRRPDRLSGAPHCGPVATGAPARVRCCRGRSRRSSGRRRWRPTYSHLVWIMGVPSMQVARAGCRARGCGQSGGSWPWRVCSSGCGPRSGSGRFRAVPGNRRRRLRILLHTAHVVGEPAVGVRVADGSGCHRRSGPEGRVLRVDEVTVYAGAQVREAIDEAVVDDHACCGALWAPTSARLTAATMAREGGWAEPARRACRRACVPDMACPDPGAYRPPGRLDSAVRRQGPGAGCNSCTLPIRLVGEGGKSYSGRHRTSARPAPPASGRTRFGPSRLRSLT